MNCQREESPREISRWKCTGRALLIIIIKKPPTPGPGGINYSSVRGRIRGIASAVARPGTACPGQGEAAGEPRAPGAGRRDVAGA